jgi:hypothetical protein
MAGPLVTVDTLVSGITLDVDRQLRMGRKIYMRFMVPDEDQLTKWRVVRVVKTGWNRISGDERTVSDGSSVIYQVAETKANKGFGAILSMKDLYVEVLGQTLSVAEVEPLAPNEAQVYTLTCRTRTNRKKFFETRK